MCPSKFRFIGACQFGNCVWWYKEGYRGWGCELGWTREGRGVGGGGLCMGSVHFRDWSLNNFGWGG